MKVFIFNVNVINLQVYDRVLQEQDPSMVVVSIENAIQTDAEKLESMSTLQFERLIPKLHGVNICHSPTRFNLLYRASGKKVSTKNRILIYAKFYSNIAQCKIWSHFKIFN